MHSNNIISFQPAQLQRKHVQPMAIAGQFYKRLGDPKENNIYICAVLPPDIHHSRQRKVLVCLRTGFVWNPQNTFGYTNWKLITGTEGIAIDPVVVEED